MSLLYYSLLHLSVLFLIIPENAGAGRVSLIQIPIGHYTFESAN